VPMYLYTGGEGVLVWSIERTCVCVCACECACVRVCTCVNVNVNELRLGFSNTTRNPEGTLCVCVCLCLDALGPGWAVCDTHVLSLPVTPLSHSRDATEEQESASALVSTTCPCVSGGVGVTSTV
jgi:hypothetical protein